MEILYTSQMEAPFGTVYLGATRRGICKVGLGTRDEFYNWLFGHVDAVEAVEREYYLLKQVAVELRKYFRGRLQEFKIPIDLRGTDFQKKVWAKLRTIDYGGTIRYGELADSIGCNGGARAVGTACGANPIPLVVPCHRVIASDKGLGGYSGGLEIKSWLLKREGVMLV
jgi:O-6-methylguanine DNA methyltransferase